MPITGNSIFRVYLEMILDRYGHGTYLHGLGTTMVLLIAMRFTPMGCLSPMELMGRKIVVRVTFHGTSTMGITFLHGNLVYHDRLCHGTISSMVKTRFSMASP